MFEKFLYCSCIIFISTTSLIESQPGTICSHFDDVSKAESCSGKTIYVENDKGSISKSELKDIVNKTIAKKLAAIKGQFDNLERKLNATARECGKFAKNCSQLENLDVQISSDCNITIGKIITEVYCDVETGSGGWMVIQRRTSDAVDFYRDWQAYKVGFGDIPDNFWLGLEAIHKVTRSQSYQLRVDLEDFSGNRAYALYSSFSIGSESSNYRLHVSGYSGNAGDSLSYSNNRPFTTKDRDNDARDGNSAVSGHGAWWYYGYGTYSNLNGKYYSSGESNDKAVGWYHWKNNYQSLKRVEMKIKPN